jgi:sulfur carrier protein
MQLRINGDEHTFSDQSSLQDILTQLEFADRKGIAVALNNAVVQRTAWENTFLYENDSISIIQATQGG